MNQYKKTKKIKKILKYIYTLKYVKLLSYIFARKLQLARSESHKHKYVYYYGFQIIFGAINKGLLLLLLGLSFGILKELMIVTLSFVLLRVWSGGLHFNSYTKCAYTSLLSLIVMGILAKYLLVTEMFKIIIFSFVLVLFLIYAPVEHKNRPLKEKEKPKFKIIAIIMLSILFVVSSAYISIGNSIVFGVLLAGLITIPIINKMA